MAGLTRKGISPVIATVIIVAVAIAIAVAVAFWMTGIVGLFTRYEKLEIVNAYADWSETNHTWVVVLQVKNSGSSDATIDEIFINGRPHDAYSTLSNPNYGYVRGRITLSANDLTNSNTLAATTDVNTTSVDSNGNTINVYISKDALPSGAELKSFDFSNGVPLKAGDELTVIILVKGPGPNQTADFKHGASVEVKLHTAAGKEYPKEIVLP